jgi:D-cysteine desulfhydrase family pyridoxal phosphate-dependent enzyme
MKFEQVPRVSVGTYPTPLKRMEKLEKKIDKPNLYIKRDDETGLAMGGNKARKIDFLLKDAIDNGYTTFLTFGGPQTNHGRMCVAAAVKYGLKPALILMGEKPAEASGNLLLDRIMDAEIFFVSMKELENVPAEDKAKAQAEIVEKATKKVLDTLESRGEKVYVVPAGGSNELGALGYVNCVKEILEQMNEEGIEIDTIVTSSGSLGTFSGLVAGVKYYNAPIKVWGVMVAPGEPPQQKAADLINSISDKYELGITCTPEELNFTNAYAGPAYNQPDPDTREYIYLLAQSEGILLDPCYTGKGFRGYVDMIQKGIINSSKGVLFLHTGGQPALFTDEHSDEMQKELWNGENVHVV